MNNNVVSIALEPPNTVRILFPPLNGNGAKESTQPEQIDVLIPPELSHGCDPRARRREAEIKWREGQVEERLQAAELAKKMGFGLQARSHTQIADLHRQAIVILGAGYSLAETGRFAWCRIDAEECKDPIPSDALTALQKAMDTGFFETYSAWSFRKYSMLVGSIRKAKWEVSFEIVRWNNVHS